MTTSPTENDADNNGHAVAAPKAAGSTRLRGRAQITQAMRDHLKHAVEHTCHMLSEQGPMSITFVHNNTLFGLQKKHFEEAIEIAENTIGVQGYLTNETMRAHYGRGRITDDDLQWAFPRRKEIDATRTVATVAGRTIASGEIYRQHMIRSLNAIDAAQLRFAVYNGDGYRFAADLPAPVRASLLQKSKADLDRKASRIGEDWTLAHFLQNQLGLDLVGHLRGKVLACLLEDQQANLSPQSALAATGVPSDRRTGYLALIDSLFDGAAAAPAERRSIIQGLWLREEAALLAVLARRHYDAAETLPAVLAHFRANPEAYAAEALWRAALAKIGSTDPFSLTDATTLEARDAGGGTQEELASAIFHMERWGGPPVMLDDALVREVTELVRAELDANGAKAEKGEPDALERAHLCWLVMHDLVGQALNRRGFDALTGLVSLQADQDRFGPMMDQLRARDPQAQMIAHARASLDRDIAGLHSGQSISDILRQLTGEDVVERVNTYMIRVCSAFLDEGLAAWHVPGRALGFYDSWRNLASDDHSFELDGLAGWRDALHRQPALAADAIIRNLEELGIEEEHWSEYLGRILSNLKGWAGMAFWNELHPHYAPQQARPIDSLQYLAVRLFYETLATRVLCRKTWQIQPDAESLEQYLGTHLSEYMVRRAYFAGELPDHLADQVSKLINQSAGSDVQSTEAWDRLANMMWMQQATDATANRVATDGWWLFNIAQYLDLGAGDLSAMTADQATAILGALDEFPDKMHRPVWLIAFERNYRDDLLNALSHNFGKARWQTRDKRPKGQIVLCIDEREENLHRSITEIDPEYETFGIAGFYGVVHDHTGMDWHKHFPLCPAVRTPAARTYEVPRDSEMQTTFPAHQNRKQWLEVLHDTLWEVKRNVVGSYFMIHLLGFLHAIPLIGRVFFKLPYATAVASWRKTVVPEVKTRMLFNRVTEAEALRFNLPLDGKPIGFTDQEQVGMAEAFLRNLGMTYNFAPVVIFTAHGSNSLNNPHENAHDCGACSGKHGLPNSRVMAALCNRPEVRDGLRERGIDITSDTWFIGAQHNTASSVITFTDEQDIPAHLLERYAVVKREFILAANMSARERCRRFAISPKDASPTASLQHVRERANDLSQVRPEWGHCTNASALVGRRSMARGVFLDRRAFNISYDPLQDPTGKILEGILMAVGPVGAGINLEYYFSTVDPKNFGSDTKVPHNVTGMLGIMEGAASDLRTGLPRQMTEVHEAMRLQVIAETKMLIAGEIYGRQPAIQELLNGQWIHFTVFDYETGEFHFFVPGVGFEKHERPLWNIPTVPDSFSHYKGKYEQYVPPALITERAARAA